VKGAHALAVPLTECSFGLLADDATRVTIREARGRLASRMEQCFFESVPGKGIQPRGACPTSMPYFHKRPIVFWSFPLLIFLSGSDARPECDSFETRNAVLQTVSDDHNNALAKYAAKNSTTAKSSDPSSEAEKSKQRLSYLLGEKIVTTSANENKRTLKCSGFMSVTVGDTKASKEVVFTVQQWSDGKITVSVDPFQF
jgi:hypothetical protein